MKLTEIEKLVLKFIGINEKYNSAGRLPFPTKETAESLIRALVEGQHEELSILISKFDLLTDTADILQCFGDRRYLGIYIEENVILACEQFIEEIKRDIAWKKRAEKAPVKAEVCCFEEFKRSREV